MQETCLLVGEALWEGILGRVHNPTKSENTFDWAPTFTVPMRGRQLKFDLGAFPCMKDALLYPIYR